MFSHGSDEFTPGQKKSDASKDGLLNCGMKEVEEANWV